MYFKHNWMSSTKIFFYTYFKLTYEHLSAVNYKLLVADSGSVLHCPEDYNIWAAEVWVQLLFWDFCHFKLAL
jgi:hypothetical protein